MLVQNFITRMCGEFQTKDSDPLDYFLSLEVYHTSASLVVSKKKYAAELLEHAGLEDYKLTVSPLLVRRFEPKGRGDEPFSNPTLFRSLVGWLQYLTTTRPDIHIVVNYVCLRMHNPTKMTFRS